MSNTSNGLCRNRVIVPLGSIDRLSLELLKFAKSISSDVTAFSVAVDMDDEIRLRSCWVKLDIDIRYVIRNSQDRKIVKPLLEFIQSSDYGLQPEDMVTVVLPRLAANKWWYRLLHNGTSASIERQLLKHKNIVAAVMPFKVIDGMLEV